MILVIPMVVTKYFHPYMRLQKKIRHHHQPKMVSRVHKVYENGSVRISDSPEVEHSFDFSPHPQDAIVDL